MPSFPDDPLLIWATAWHLVMATAGALTAMLGSEAWRKQAEHRFRTTLVAFAIITFIQLALAALALWPIVPLPLVRALDTASAMLIGWGLAAPFLPPGQERAWLIIGVVCDVLLGAVSFALWATSAARVEPGWTLIAWGVLSALGVGAGAVMLIYRQKERPTILISALGVLSLGALLWTFGPETEGRALWLAAFVTLPTGVARWMLRESEQSLESTDRELQLFSQHALRQTQQLIVLLRASTTLVAQTSVSDMLVEAVEGIALGAGADLALIALIGADPNKTIGVMAIYPPRTLDDPISFPLNSHALIAQAIHTNQQMILDPDIGLEHHPIYALLGGDQAGPAIVQPMRCQDRIIGVIIVGNTRDKHPLSEGAGRLLEALGAQIATAIENVQMYHRLNTQAKDLAHLLTIREEEASQRAAILESIADGVVVTNKDDKIILMNVAAANILNVDRAELIGMSADQVSAVLPMPLGVFRVSDDASMLETVRMDFRLNERSVQASLAPVQTQSGELLGVVAILRDITRERQAARAKSEFIATISHELRTPLTSIKGYADLVNAGVAGPLNEEQQAFIGKICRQSEHLTRLINQVIQYSEMERGGLVMARQPFDMGQVVRAAVESVNKRIEADGFDVTLNVEPGTPLVYADPTYTRQIVDQLLDNALRFTPAPGHIMISICPAEKEQEDREGRYLSSLSPSSLSVSLSISDTGVGIASEDIERVFERFYRADNPMQVATSGLGLGLTMARTLAEAQGGQLWAASPAIEQPVGGSTAGHPGSTFTLRLPAMV